MICAFKNILRPCGVHGFSVNVAYSMYSRLKNKTEPGFNFPANAIEAKDNDWTQPTGCKYYVLWYKAKNMIIKKCVARLLSLPHVAHTLQLAVHKGLLAKRRGADVYF